MIVTPPRNLQYLRAPASNPIFASLLHSQRSPNAYCTFQLPAVDCPKIDNLRNANSHGTAVCGPTTAGSLVTFLVVLVTQQPYSLSPRCAGTRAILPSRAKPLPTVLSLILRELCFFANHANCSNSNSNSNSTQLTTFPIARELPLQVLPSVFLDSRSKKPLPSVVSVRVDGHLCTGSRHYSVSKRLMNRICREHLLVKATYHQTMCRRLQCVLVASSRS